MCAHTYTWVIVCKWCMHVTACVEVRRQPMELVLTFHLVRSRVPLLVIRFAGPRASWGSLVSTSQAAVGMLGLQMHATVFRFL